MFSRFKFHSLGMQLPKASVKAIFSYVEGTLNEFTVLHTLLICMILTSPFINLHSFSIFFSIYNIIHFGYCTSSHFSKVLLKQLETIVEP